MCTALGVIGVPRGPPCPRGKRSLQSIAEARPNLSDARALMPARQLQNLAIVWVILMQPPTRGGSTGGQRHSTAGCSRGKSSRKSSAPPSPPPPPPRPRRRRAGRPRPRRPSRWQQAVPRPRPRPWRRCPPCRLPRRRVCPRGHPRPRRPRRPRQAPRPRSAGQWMTSLTSTSRGYRTSCFPWCDHHTHVTMAFARRSARCSSCLGLSFDLLGAGPSKDLILAPPPACSRGGRRRTTAPCWWRLGT